MFLGVGFSPRWVFDRRRVGGQEDIDCSDREASSWSYRLNRAVLLVVQVVQCGHRGIVEKSAPLGLVTGEGEGVLSAASEGKKMGGGGLMSGEAEHAATSGPFGFSNSEWTRPASHTVNLLPLGRTLNVPSQRSR